MTDDTSPAFGPLDARAGAATGPGAADRLSLRDHIVTAEIGAFQHERGREQRLRFNVVVELAPQDRPGDDDVDRILSYDRLTEAIAAELRAERLNLLETLAERIAARILAEPQAARVFLRIEKLDLAPGALGVEIVRDRAGGTVEAGGQGARPMVHLLTAPALPALAEGPAVLVPAAPLLPLPPAWTPAAGRRIALLALEQAAWSLAARDSGLRVVATRTELDWALARGERVVWAPAKMALDTPGAPETAAPAALAAWLAGLLDAECLVVHGPVAIPAGCRVPVVPA
ncbi:dihydroneopterin aldolase [Albidovulum sp.]|uniref:dihydroneopterin aldolase n=1 Tax=Albidovulum sp. TaxID=1872424 RepID=UPI0039B911BC